MAAIPTGRPIIPFSPTVDENHSPTICKACGCVAFGIGRSTPGSKDPGYLCKPCIVAIGDLTKLDRVSIYEVKALEAGVEAVGEWLDEKGIYDLTLMDDLDRLMLVKAAWEGCARGVRDAMRDAPF